MQVNYIEISFYVDVKIYYEFSSCRFGSQFMITLGENLDSLDNEHLIFGQIVNSDEVLDRLNATLSDDNHRPYQDIRITHTVVLHDPFPDPKGLSDPGSSPVPTKEMLESNYIGADEVINDNEGKSQEELKEEIEAKEAQARATILEIVGDIPDADVAPPENVLFVCKLNPVTTSDDLEVIFSRFGRIVSCEVIKDRVTDNSLQYAFIEFENPKACESAYFKMDNVLIDERRIHVDFSQSVSKIKWTGKGRIEYFDDDGNKIDSKSSKKFNPNKDDYKKKSTHTNGNNQNRYNKNYGNRESSKSDYDKYHGRYKDDHRDGRKNNFNRYQDRKRDDRSFNRQDDNRYNYRHHHYDNESHREKSSLSHNRRDLSPDTRHRSIKDKKESRRDISKSPSPSLESLKYSSESRGKVLKQLKKELKKKKKKDLDSSPDKSSKKKHKKKKKKLKKAKDYSSDSDSEDESPKKRKKSKKSKNTSSDSDSEESPKKRKKYSESYDDERTKKKKKKKHYKSSDMSDSSN